MLLKISRRPEALEGRILSSFLKGWIIKTETNRSMEITWLHENQDGTSEIQDYSNEYNRIITSVNMLTTSHGSDVNYDYQIQQSIL